MTQSRQIIATSAGFAIEPRNKRMDRYILAQSPKKRPKICFIGTASGDSSDYIKRFYNFFNKENCQPNHLDLFRGNIVQVEKHILAQDIIYVGGGNTINMLAIWRNRGIDKMLTKAYHQGVLLCGISAGSLCWFEQGVTDSYPGRLSEMDCLGFIKGSNCPFYGEEKRKTYRKLLAQNQILPGIATEIGVGLHYIDESIHRIVSSRKNAKAFSFERAHKKVHISELVVDYLK